jgi:ubiquinol-cytochrome c reductase cytochrome c subunit
MTPGREGPGGLRMNRSAARSGSRGVGSFSGDLSRRRLRLAALSCVILAILFAAATVAPAGASSSPSPSPSVQPFGGVSPAVEAGADPGAVVFAQNCAGCHGSRGEGGFGPPLAPAGFASLVIPMVEEGGIQMPSFSDQLSDAEIQAVAAYVAAHIADPASHEAVVSGGGETYRLYCAGCHSTTGRGGALTRGRNAPDMSQYPAAEALAAMILGRGNMPAFAGNTLDVRQQTAVGLYVSVLVDPPSPGGRGLGYLGPVTEGAVSAVALLILIFLAVWLAWKSRTAAP